MGNQTESQWTEFCTVEEQINQELKALDRNISSLPSKALDIDTYHHYTNHFNYVESLLGNAAVIEQSLTLSQEDPDIRKILDTKQDFERDSGYFHRIRAEFFKTYRCGEEDLNNTECQSKGDAQPDEEPLDDLEEAEDASLQNDMEDVEDPIAAQKKAERRKASRERQVRYAREGLEQERRYKAEQSGITPPSEADLAAARLRVLEEREQRAREAEEQIRREKELLAAARMREYQPVTYESADTGPIELPQTSEEVPPSAQTIPEPHYYGTAPYDAPSASDLREWDEMREMQLRGGMGPSCQEQPEAVSRPLCFTPEEGVIPEHLVGDVSPKQTIDGRSYAFDNVAILSTLQAAKEGYPDQPLPISPAYVQQMTLNLNQAQNDYFAAQSTSQMKECAHILSMQRTAYKQLQAELEDGRFMQNPQKAPEPVRERLDRPAGISSNYTPEGLASQSVENGAAGGTHYFKRTESSPHIQYSAANPLRVTPAYEQAINERLQLATKEINGIIADNSTIRIPKDLQAEVSLATKAYQGFQAAKNAGTVVICEDANRNRPDFKAWRDIYSNNPQQTTRKNPFGPTIEPQHENSNQSSKEKERENKVGVFLKKNVLNRESLAARYVQALAFGTENFAAETYRQIGSRAVYLVERADETGSLSTISTAHNYIAVAGCVADAVTHARIADAAKTGKTFSRIEAVRFGNLSGMSNQELMQLSNQLRSRMNVVDGKITGFPATLSPAQEAQMQELHGALSRQRKMLSQIECYQSYVKDGKARVAVHQTLENSLPPIVSKTQLRQEMKHLKQVNADAMTEFFGSSAITRRNKARQDRIDNLLQHRKLLEGQIKALESKPAFTSFDRNQISQLKGQLNATNRKLGKQVMEPLPKKGAGNPHLSANDLKKRIDKTAEKAKALKVQIRAIEAKGSAASAAERKLLMQLKNKQITLSAQLSKLHQAFGIRTAFDSKDHELNLLLNRLEKNRYAYRRFGSTLFGLITRPVQQGSEIGAQGLLDLVNLASNRHVHDIVRRAVKASMSAGHLTALGAKYAGSIMKQTAIKTGVANAKPIKKAVAEVNKIHTRVTHVSHRVQKLHTTTADTLHRLSPKRRFAVVTDKARAAFYKTALGKNVQKATDFFYKLKNGFQVTGSFLKGFIAKVGLAFVAIFIIIAIICSTTSLIGGSAGAVILSPGVKNDKIDLSPYVDIIQEQQAKFDSEIAALQNDSHYSDVKINYLTTTMNNTKEMLSMMAVYLCQDLDLKTNQKIKDYLITLFQESHTYTTSETTTYCSGCRTRIDADGETVKYCPGHKHLTINISILGFDEIFTADTVANSVGDAVAGKKIGAYTITYYCCEKYPHVCNAGPPYRTATGTQPTPGRTIAVDPSVIPLGSHVVIDGHEYMAEDTGGGVGGNHIDICVQKHKEALQKGKRTGVPVYWASYKGSGVQETGRWEGWTKTNQAWCKAIYSTNWSDLYTGISDYSGVIEDGNLIASGTYIWPVTTTTSSSGYGWRIHPITGVRTFHKGTDIPVPVGTPVHAAADGVVTIAQNSQSAGLFIKIDHANGVSTRYLHNSHLLVHVGDKVKAGQIISYSGSTGHSTGPHLHFEFLVNGSPIDPRRQYGLS